MIGTHGDPVYAIGVTLIVVSAALLFVSLVSLMRGLYRREDLCPRCGGDHDRIDRREPCP